MSGNLTLSRLTKTTGNLVENPFFEHFSGGDVSLDSGLEDKSYHGNLFSLAPGWFAFGPYPQIQFTNIPVLDQDYNPFLQSDSNAGEGRQKSGIQIELTSRDAQTSFAPTGGLVQRLRVSTPLVGKKLRISGCYRVKQKVVGVDTGISVWLQGKPSGTAVRKNNYSFGSAGVTSNIVDTFTDAFATFVADGVQEGDILFADQQVNPTNGGFYVVKSVELNTSLTLYTPCDTAAVGVKWVIARKGATPPYATLIGRVGIANWNPWGVGHVISWQDGNGSFPGKAEEWGIRAFDSLVIPKSGNFGDTVPTKCRVLAFGKYDPLANPHTGVDDSYLQGPLPDSNSYMLFLNYDWLDDPAEGNIHLVTSTAAEGGDVTFFEEIVDIPLTFTPEEELRDFFLCVFPVHPIDSYGILTDAKVQLFALTAELILDDDSEGEERLLYQFGQGSPGGRPGFGMSGYDVRHCLQYPIYRPMLLPLDVHMLPAQIMGDITDLAVEITSNGGWYAHGDGLDGVVFWSKQFPIGPDVVAIDAAFWLHNHLNFDPAGVTYFNLLGFQHKYPGATDNQAANIIARNSCISGSEPPLPAQISLTVRRNRGGLFWPWDGFGGGGAVPSDLAKNGVWDVKFKVTSAPCSGGGAQLTLSHGYMLCAVDPRIMHAYWSKD